MHPVIRISLISALNWSIMSSLQRGSETISESGDFVPFSRQSFKKFKVQSWEIGTCYLHSIKSWFLTTAGMHHFVNADLNTNQYTRFPSASNIPPSMSISVSFRPPDAKVRSEIVSLLHFAFWIETFFLSRSPSALRNSLFLQREREYRLSASSTHEY